MAEFVVGSSIMESGCDVGTARANSFACNGSNPVRVYAVWDSNAGCVSTPSSTFIWYYWNGSSWVEFARGTPGIYQGYVYWWLDIIGCNYKYKVTFAGMSAEFTIGTVAPSLVVTGVTAAMSTNPSYPAKDGWVTVTVSATGAGSFAITVDGSEVKRQSNVNAGSGSSWGFPIKMTPGNHNVCAVAV